MANKVGINGFGRIGRLAFRAACARDYMEVVGINDQRFRTRNHLLLLSLRFQLWQKYQRAHDNYCGNKDPEAF